MIATLAAKWHKCHGKFMGSISSDHELHRLDDDGNKTPEMARARRQDSGNCVGVGTHSHVWDCGSPRYTRALPADTHWTRAEHLAVRPRSSTRRKLSSLTAAYGRRSQFTCPAHVVEPRGEPAKHDLTAAYLAGRRRPLQAHVAESYQPAIAEHPRGKSHALQEYDTFAPAVHRPEK
ncbi:hypothetical protein pipiens_017158 [Culex pipiens pipiens]|uniref:Uncharacterized protein n=1 Tax=Culex pipiens pipiens TaxID=38569 RepID=A0ABD1CHX9_CULPP